MEWIKCDKLLPENGVNVLVYGYFGIFIAHLEKKDKIHKWHCFPKSDHDGEISGVTYWMPLPDQPERSKREDFYPKIAKEYLDSKEYWETNPSERISIEGFANYLDRRCGTLNSMET